ncbi:hypothetical protein [Cardinium endosymbiont of Culicoides punctatus]|uniref:hypothetical protein n=1 Tax=Cardinium endosymbiont of Culicoides punctatus TaxID=2304601 RepID=UPI0010589188|nr:hypothetical protein [Cardinium endosymbiont of Culicoides punctatus]TDG95683.1 hypothetical protein CCPUN_01460 [Cardinium endosymbiont of Culicoides punctatus]
MYRLKRLLTYGILLLLITIYFGIRYGNIWKQNKTISNDPFIARVGNQYLYPSDIELLNDTCPETTDKSPQYIKEWACRQLLIAYGTSHSHEIQPLVEDKINDYKNDLLAHHILEKFVNQELNSDVSLDEIANYYNNNPNDFILNCDIVKGTFLSMPKKATGINAIKSLMLSTKPIDRKKLETYCKPYMNTVILESSKWISWEFVLRKIGFQPLGDATRLLKTNKFIHVPSRKRIYFLKIDEYKIAPGIAPLALMEERIKTIILHKRRLALASQIKEKLLENAKKNNTCVIHVN